MISPLICKRHGCHLIEETDGREWCPQCDEESRNHEDYDDDEE